jgi:hypothetical protein
MRPIWIALAAASFAATGSAMAQGLIPPSRQLTPQQLGRQYATPQREKLDPNFSVPTFGLQSESMPKQRTQTPQVEQEPRADPFKPMQSFANPVTKPSETAPDFFQPAPGLANNGNSDVPNFFDTAQDTPRPKAANKPAGETSLYTTDTGLTTGNTATPLARPDNPPNN